MTGSGALRSVFGIFLIDRHQAVRKTYDGPLTLADDMTVWNVTDEKVVVREAVVTEDVAPPGTTQAYRTAKREPPQCGCKMDLARHQRR